MKENYKLPRKIDDIVTKDPTRFLDLFRQPLGSAPCVLYAKYIVPRRVVPFGHRRSYLPIVELGCAALRDPICHVRRGEIEDGYRACPVYRRVLEVLLLSE